MKSTLLALLLCLPGALFADDLWIDHVEGSYTLIRGPLNSDGAGQAYDPAIVQRVFCALRGGLVMPAPFLAEQPVRIINDCSALLVEVSTGYWSKTAQGVVNRPQTEVPGALTSWFSEESVKRLDDWSPAMAIPTADAFEIVPKSNPLTLQPGATLPVEVVYQGVPIPHAGVSYNGVHVGVTGDAGLMNVTIRQGGRQQITASAKWPGDDRAFRVVRTTTLQFDLPSP